MTKQKWDVTEEEENRVLLPANDCRRFNGGWVAPPEIKKLWEKRTKEEQVEYNCPKVIDRLRI